MDRRQKQELAQRFGGHTLRRRLALQDLRHDEWFRRGPRITKRPLNWLCGAIRFVCRATGIYGIGYRQFHRPRVTCREVLLERLPPAFDGLRLLHLTDLHLDLDASFTATLLNALAGCEYDVCVMTGDYRNYTVGDHGPAMDELRHVLAAIRQPIYGVLGNHDSIESVPVIEEMGMRMLLNEHVLLRRGEATLCFAGVDDPNVYQTHRLDRALRGVPKGVPVVLLSHSPAIHGAAAEAGVDLVLAGHIHGGQICLPGGGIILRNDISPRRVWRGPWCEGSTQGYTSRGTGSCGVPLRFFCPPEIVIHVLRSPRTAG
jgi:hypothetical protein